jgi:hypothetical protein
MKRPEFHRWKVFEWFANTARVDPPSPRRNVQTATLNHLSSRGGTTCHLLAVVVPKRLSIDK